MNTVLQLSGPGVVIDGVGFDIHTMLYAAGATVLGVQLVDPVSMMRVAIPSVTLMLAGAEIVFACFLLGFIDVRSRGATES